MNSDSRPGSPSSKSTESNAPEPDSPGSRNTRLNSYEIIFTMPPDLVEDPESHKSLNFHRFMRHARQCHQHLLEFLMRENLLQQTGDCTLIANERQTIIACTQNAIEKIRRLPFVEKTTERPDIAAQPRTENRRRPPSHGK
jgi:hypothetical protein